MEPTPLPDRRPPPTLAAIDDRLTAIEDAVKEIRAMVGENHDCLERLAELARLKNQTLQMLLNLPWPPGTFPDLGPDGSGPHRIHVVK